MPKPLSNPLAVSMDELWDSEGPALWPHCRVLPRAGLMATLPWACLAGV